jgi:hypothetical protein
MLHAQGMKKTVEWFETVLGFSLSADSGKGWRRLSRDQVTIMFMEIDHLGPPQATATQYISVDDVIALWSSIKDRRSAEWGPEEMPYGMLEFVVRDRTVTC